MANSSSRPSALEPIASSAAPGPPRASHSDHAPFTVFCQAWWTPSAPAAKTSSRPSADRAETTRPDSAGYASGPGPGSW